MTAIARKPVKIYIAPTGVNAASVGSSTTFLILGEIVSYKKSGGENDVESVPAFGGFIDKEKPRSQMEVEFEVIPSLETASSDRWDALIYGTNASGVYATNSDAADRTIMIEATTSVGTKSWAWNNCSAVVFDIEHNADDNQTGTFRFKLSPVDTQGIPNFMTKATTLVSLPAWSTLTA